MTSFSGTRGVATYVAIVLAAGLRLYAQTGIKPNKAYTPKAMMQKAAQMTGQKFKARNYIGAAQALDAWVRENGASHGDLT